jgi:hypothetical protein
MYLSRSANGYYYIWYRDERGNSHADIQWRNAARWPLSSARNIVRPQWNVSTPDHCVRSMPLELAVVGGLHHFYYGRAA